MAAPPDELPKGYRLGTTPLDTVFVELGRETGGCVWIDSTYVPGPYVVSAAFASGPDSAYLGVAVNRRIPNEMRAFEGARVHPSEARRVAFLWSAYRPHDGRRLRPEQITKQLQAMDPGIVSAQYEPSAKVITLLWSYDPEPWTFELFAFPYVLTFQKPRSRDFSHLLTASQPLSALRHKERVRFMGGAFMSSPGSCSERPH